MPRIIFFRDTPEFWAAVALILLVGLGIALYRWLRPPASKKLLADNRYLRAVSVFAGALPPPDVEPTAQQREGALAAAVEYLTQEHGVPPEEARANLRVVVGEYNKERSYELRHEAIGYEQAGAYELALELYERAARLREEHDREDYEFLQRCIARVRARVRPGKEEA